MRVFLFVLAAAFVSFGSTVPVSIFALDYVGGKGVGAEVKIYQWPSLALWANATTSSGSGRVTVHCNVGDRIFVVAESKRHRTTQSPIVVVPDGGLAGRLNEVVLQMPGDIMFEAFWWTTPGKKDKTKCQLVVTVCDANKTVGDLPQGIPGAVASLSPPRSSMTFYFGTMLGNLTDPLPNHLNSTSWDGGVLFENIPVDPLTLYTVKASLSPYTFTETVFSCNWPGMFVNGAPNQGPRMK